MEPILKVAKKYGLAVIEDAAQSQGAAYIFSDGTKKQAGTMRTIGVTSFFPSKNLGCFGDGGALFTNDSSLAERMKMIANHGQKIKYQHEIVGINSRLDTLQAAILNVKLKYLEEYHDKRQAVASYYDAALTGIAELDIPFRAPYSTHVFNQYTIKVKNGDRDGFKKYLSEAEIPTMIYYPVPLHLQKAYRGQGFTEGTFPITENLSSVVLSLPIHTEMTMDQTEFICGRIKHYFCL
jgi:dTDP-4-amino-4,6-dideoxygalactose transaminase